MNNRTFTVRLHLWLENRGEFHFGLGRALLFLKIEEHGSIRKAASELGMSYRAAWGKIRKTEEILGTELVARSGCKRDGCRLTDAGKAMTGLFMRWFDQVELEAVRLAREIFPWSVREFDEAGFGSPPELELDAKVFKPCHHGGAQLIVK